MAINTDNVTTGPVPACTDAIKIWFKQNGWPQAVTEGWARAAGSEVGPWASQISILMAGRLEPKPFFFAALGEFNDAVATRNLAAVTDQRLRNRLMNGQPMCHENGQPFDAADFFRLYIGALDAPKKYTKPKTISDEAAAKLSAVCVDLP